MKSVARLLCVLMLLSSLVYTAQRETRVHGGISSRSLAPRTASPVSLKKTNGIPLPAGTYTVGTGGYFPTLDSAFSRLSSGGISGGVMLMLTDTLYDALGTPGGSFKLVGPISGTGPSSRITIRPADNVQVRVEGFGEATFNFFNVSYLTLDGISLGGSTSMKIHAPWNPSGTRWNDAVDLTGNCDYGVIQNITVGSDDPRLDAAGIAMWAEHPQDGLPDSCLVTGVAVTAGGFGIIVVGDSANSPKGNVIRRNRIGSSTDSLVAWGIQLEWTDHTIVENNVVENLRRSSKDISGTLRCMGINAFSTKYTVIRNNVVHGSRGNSGTQLYGISGTGDDRYGQYLQIYNNMIYDLENRSTTGTPWTEGIFVWWNNNATVAYNTVVMSGTGSWPNSVDALGLYYSVNNCRVRNNILVNTYQSLNNSDSCTAFWTSPSAGFSSDYNDLYVDSPNVLAWTDKQYRTLSEFQGSGSDAHSVSMLPVFVAPYLHLDSMHTTTEFLMNKGMPIAGVVDDFDGQLRDVSTPDIGADEIVEVKSTAGIAWMKDPRNPVLSGGGSTGYSLAMNPCVIYNADSARFEMWFNRAASSSAARPWLVGYATSPDGISWTQRTSAVLSPTPGTWDANTTDVPTVIRENGTYKMWYSSFLNSTSPGHIGYATSPDGINWTKYAGNPIFGPGTAAWEAGGPFACSVMPVPGGYKIWYDAYDASAGTSRFGYATSVDGIVWHRDTVHNPILTLGVTGAWDDNNTAIPRVLKIRIVNSSDMYFMWYAGSRSDGRTKAGLALSPDGITGWTRSPHNPVLGPDPGAWDGTDAGIGSVMLYKDILHAWYDGGTRPASTNLWHIGHATSRTPVTDVFETTQRVPAEFALEQNYPNPFNPSTIIRFQLQAAGEVKLAVYDLLGREVAVLVNERRNAGVHEVKFDAAGLASGVYFYRLNAGSYVNTKKLLLVR